MDTSVLLTRVWTAPALDRSQAGVIGAQHTTGQSNRGLPATTRGTPTTVVGRVRQNHGSTVSGDWRGLIRSLTDRCSRTGRVSSQSRRNSARTGTTSAPRQGENA